MSACDDWEVSVGQPGSLVSEACTADFPKSPLSPTFSLFLFFYLFFVLGRVVDVLLYSLFGLLCWPYRPIPVKSRTADSAHTTALHRYLIEAALRLAPLDIVVVVADNQNRDVEAPAKSAAVPSLAGPCLHARQSLLNRRSAGYFAKHS